MKYRPHRRLIDESAAEAIELADRASLLARVREELKDWRDVSEEELSVKPYGYQGAVLPDPRIGWADTWIVCVEGYGPIGWTDGKPPTLGSKAEKT